MRLTVVFAHVLTRECQHFLPKDLEQHKKFVWGGNSEKNLSREIGRSWWLKRVPHVEGAG